MAPIPPRGAGRRDCRGRGVDDASCEVVDPVEYLPGCVAEVLREVRWLLRGLSDDLVDLEDSPPGVSITQPSANAIYSQDEDVPSDFSCSEGSGGPGVGSCLDQDGRSSGSQLDTTSTGPHSFTVTATSSDGLISSQTVSYTVESDSSPTPTTPLTTSQSAPTPGRFTISKVKLHDGDELSVRLVVPAAGTVRLSETVRYRGGTLRVAQKQLSFGNATTTSATIKPGSSFNPLFKKPATVTLRINYTAKTGASVTKTIGNIRV